MVHDQLEINRSAHGENSRWPMWVNIATVSCAIVLISVMSFWTVYQSEATLQANVSSKLKTILRIESEAVRQWLVAEERFANLLASDSRLAEQMVNSDLPESKRDLDDQLLEIARKLDSKTALLITIDGETISEFGEGWLSEWIATCGDQLCQSMVDGKPIVSSVRNPGKESDGASHHSLAVVAPVEHGTLGIVGFLAIGHDVEAKLTKVLASSRTGETGETIAVSSSGVLISQSRSWDESDFEHVEFMLGTDGAETTSSMSRRQSVLSELTDQRGVETVFVKRWLPRLGIGLITKMDRAEAFAPITQMRKFVWTLFGLLLLTTVSTVFYRFYIYRLRKLARQAELKRMLLGAYELEEKIGEGGMGVVYRAKHALLRRPTAIKILPPEKSSQMSIERFEREVRYTSQLKHPNTISIYDYGRTANGLFYYAMELLDGLNLEQLIRRESILPDGRVVKILRQTCESLREAHSLDLIHRDIKPANIILCNRGGAVDTVKVLDFGMVHDQTEIVGESDGKLSGTPTYMAPESFTDPDAVDERVDVFAVGAVGFFLLTGKPLLEAGSINGIVSLHQSDLQSFALREIERVGKESGFPVSDKLAQLIASCVSNQRDDRPNSVANVLAKLAQCRPNRPWSNSQAQQWWRSATPFVSGVDAGLDNDEASVQDNSLDVTQEFKPTKNKNQETKKIDSRFACNVA